MNAAEKAWRFRCTEQPPNRDQHGTGAIGVIGAVAEGGVHSPGGKFWLLRTEVIIW